MYWWEIGEMKCVVLLSRREVHSRFRSMLKSILVLCRYFCLNPTSAAYHGKKLTASSLGYDFIFDMLSD